MRWADTQAAFALAITQANEGIPGLEQADGLNIYRNNLRLTLQDALGVTYPAIRQLVGDVYFAMIASHYAQSYLPQQADLNAYGEHFAAMIESHRLRETLPYLPDMARYEWAWQRAYYASDMVSQGWPQHSPERLLACSVRFHPSLQLLRLNYDAAAIWAFCMHFKGEGTPPDASANQYFFALSRTKMGGKVHCQPLNKAQYKAACALQNGHSLQSAFATYDEDEIQSFIALLLRSGWAMELV